MNGISWAWIFLLLFLWQHRGFAVGEEHDSNGGKDGTQRKTTAVVTLVTTSDYVKGAQVLGYSLNKVNATGERVLLYVLPEDDPRSDLTQQDLDDLHHAGWTTTRRLSEKDGTLSVCRVSEQQQKLIDANAKELAGLSRYWGTCSKFAVWTLTEYDVVVYIDADSLVLHNFDFVYGLLDGDHGHTLFAQGTPGCWEDPPDCDTFYGAFMVIKPIPHIHKYLHDLSTINFLAEGELPLLNKVYKSWQPLPRYTLVAQTEIARPRLNDDPQQNVDWSRVKVYDFSGSPVTKPWVTYALQKEKGDKFVHGYFGNVPPESPHVDTYMEPQWVWNEYYDAVLESEQDLEPKSRDGDSSAEEIVEPDL